MSRMVVSPIRTEGEYERALAEVAEYFEHEPRPGTAAADRFDVLATLIEAYEREHWPIEPLDAVDAIRYRMQQSGYSQADFAELIGSRPRASEILRRKRDLTMKMARKLHDCWQIPAESLLRQPTLPRSRRRSTNR